MIEQRPSPLDAQRRGAHPGDEIFAVELYAAGQFIWKAAEQRHQPAAVRADEVDGLRAHIYARGKQSQNPEHDCGHARAPQTAPVMSAWRRARGRGTWRAWDDAGRGGRRMIPARWIIGVGWAVRALGTQWRRRLGRLGIGKAPSLLAGPGGRRHF